MQSAAEGIGVWGMTDFPLCDKARLDIHKLHKFWKGGAQECIDCVFAKDVEAYLSTLKSTQQETLSMDTIIKAADHPVWGLRGNSEQQFVEAVQAQMDEGFDKMHREYIEKTCIPKGDDRMTKADNEFFRPEDFISVWQMNGLQAIADQANRLLKERSKTVFGRVDGDFGWFDSSDLKKTDGFREKTHQALLVNIMPIAKPADTAEGLLREIVAAWKAEYTGPVVFIPKDELMVRAKEFLSLHDSYAKDPDGI